MLDESKTEIVLGPPGTGKTTKLISMVREDLKNGIRPDEIGFLSFTRFAAEEAAQRAVSVLGLDPKDLRYFTTIHAMAKRQSGITGPEVMNNGHLREFSNEIGFKIMGRIDLDEGAVWGGAEGDRMMHLVNLARARCIDLRACWEDGNDDIPWSQVEYFASGLQKYKARRQVRDFTDMLDLFLESGIAPRLRHLFVDEAQDLSELQWRCIEKLAADVPRVTIAGDDDQLIYRFNGASLDRFLTLPGRVEVLGQSHRVPRSVQMLAHAVISRVKQRRPKEWAARPDEGNVRFETRIEDIDMSEGTWLILARNGYLLDRPKEFVHSEGFFYRFKKASSVRLPAYNAIQIWNDLHRGARITAGEAAQLYEYLPVNSGFKRGSKAKITAIKDDRELRLSLDDLRRDYGLVAEGRWQDVLRIPAEDAVYYDACLARGERLEGTPRITLSTIHGTKGGEADNVIVIPDMAARTFREMNDGGEDDETRAFYVALTRARKNLFIMQPQSPQYYPI